MKKKPIVIEVNESYVYPKKSNGRYPKESLYKEKTNVIEQEFVLNKNLSLIDQLKVIKKYNDKLNNEIKKLDKEIAIYKLFKPSAKVDEVTINNLNNDFNNLDKYTNKFKRELDENNSFFGEMDEFYHIKGTNLLITEKVNSDDVNKIYEKTLYLFSFLLGLNSDLNKIKKTYFREFKLTSYGIVRTKTVDEINALTKSVEEELAKSRNIKNACDYIIYNSGTEIQGLVDEFVKLNRKYPFINYRYFLAQDVIFDFSFNEWIELFIKFNYVLGKLNPKDVSDKLVKKFNDLEVKYAILLIDSEREVIK